LQATTETEELPPFWWYGQPHMDTSRPLRADAERNRARILAAAGQLFAERGLDVSLDDIAAAAGVGVGTVYRRFPDKDALIDALFEEKIHQARALATEALAIEDPWEGFAFFMREMCTMQAGDRGFRDALLSRDRGLQRVAAAREAIAPVAVQVLHRAQEAGAVRDDLGTFDVPMLHLCVGLIAERTRDAAPDYWERILTVILDGLAAGAQRTPMTAAPLDRDAFANAMVSGRPKRRA
jgi:AcrR family transcriptional regulator